MTALGAWLSFGAAIVAGAALGFAAAHWLRWRDGRARRELFEQWYEEHWGGIGRRQTAPAAPKGTRADMTNSREGSS